MRPYTRFARPKRPTHKKRRSVSKPDKPSKLKSGDDLSSRSVSRQVLSARESLTSVFGMGTGGSFLPLSPLWLYTKPFRAPYIQIVRVSPPVSYFPESFPIPFFLSPFIGETLPFFKSPFPKTYNYIANFSNRLPSLFKLVKIIEFS